jgi:hypothetical protein
MKPTWRRIALCVLLALVPIVALGRLFQIPDPKKLFADAELVFVGQVTSVKPSGIRMSLSYIPYEGVRFQWQIVEVKVMEPFKGVRKGGHVKAAMLSIDELSPIQSMYSPPGMLKPEKDDVFLLCLAPAPKTNLFATLTAPYNENLSILALHRDRQVFDARDERNQPVDSRDAMNQVLSSSDRRFPELLGLVDSTGKIVSANVQKARQTYSLEISRAPRTNVVYLEWETRTNASGWQSDWPRGHGSATNANKR